MTENVQFDEDKISRKPNTPKTSGMINFLIKNKIVKNSQQASLLLIFIAATLLLISTLLLAEIKKEPTPQYQPDPAELL